MKFSYVAIGGGITGVETTIELVRSILKKYKKNALKQKLSIAIIDKNPENIPGGIAYGFKMSKYGYFNNPIRLSPKNFQDWISDIKIKNKIISYLKTNGGHTGYNWIKKNKKTLFSKNKKNLEELYVPRAISNAWMEEKLVSLLNQIKKQKLFCEIKFFKGEAINIQVEKNGIKNIVFKNNICKELNYNIKKSSFKKMNFFEGKKIKSIKTHILSIGIGLPPPKQLADKNAQKNQNYIWDFYTEGSTSKLINLISSFPPKKKILVYFIGYKAGLLEALPELEQVIKKKRLNIKLICSSKNLVSIQKAQISQNKNKYKLFFLKKKKLKNIKKAKQIVEFLDEEFNLAVKKGFNKYDVWSLILKKNILHKCLVNLDKKQQGIYNSTYHNKIRNLTRFTYPETILARENLSRKNILISNRENVKKVEYKSKKLLVKTVNNLNIKKNYLCEIVVNVSGPLNVESLEREIPLVNNLKINGAKVNSGGFIVNNHFEIKGLKNIFTSGILARGFNPERKTIFSAILKNSLLVGKNIAKVLIKWKKF